MASRLKLAVDIRDVSKDLRAIADGLDRPIADVLESGAKQIARDARPLVAGKPPWRGSKDIHATEITYEGMMAPGVTLAAYVTSIHPGAAVQEFGGTIHPDGHQFHHLSPAHPLSGGGVHITGKHAVARAGQADAEDITRRLEDAVDRLVAEHGF